MPTLHVVIPCFNEKRTLEPCIRRICSVQWNAGWDVQLIVVDDNSSDESVNVARALAEEFQNIEVVTHSQNQGKGSSVREGMSLATSRGSGEDLLVIQDADLEYDPNDLPGMVDLFLADKSTGAAVGDRFDRGRRQSQLGRKHKVINRSLTRLSNLFTGLKLHDMECCYKMMRLEVARLILPELTEDRFGIEPQIAAVLSRKHVVTKNHLVRYNPRTIQQGKKIGLRDGFRAVYVILKEAVARGRE